MRVSNTIMNGIIIGGGVLLVAIVFIVGVWASGKAETVRVHHVSETTDCIIVSRAANVSIDCFVVEGEHEHE